jgi:putative component of toxin-antitoxin plasmid stabilization module
VVYPGGNASASNPGHGWSAVAAAPSGSGYRFYWRNNANQQVALWNLNASGVYQSGGFLSASELFSEEASLNLDLNGDGYTTGPSTINGVNLGSTFLGYALLAAGGTPLQVVYSGGNASASNPGNGLSAVAAAPSGSGYRLYWRNSASQQVTLWNLNASGIYQAGGVLSASQLVSEEANLNFDLNADGFISGPVSINGVNLGSTYSGYALQRAGGTPLQVVYPGGNASASNPGNGWSAVAAAPSGSGYRLYWRHNDSQQMAVWTLNASGVYTSGSLLSASQLFNEEANLNLDLNIDGYISGPSTINGVNLGATFLGYALLQAGGTPLQVTYPGGNASISNPGNGWSAVAAAANGAGYRFYWRNTTTQQVALWNLDASGSYQSGGFLSDAQVYSNETSLNADLNNDTVIGSPFTNVENQGNASLLRRPDGMAVVQVGSNRYPVTSPFNLGVGDRTSTWQMLAAENIAGQPQILWRNNPANFLHLWSLDSSWSWQSSYGEISPFSPLAVGLENNFQIDLNGNGVIG